MISLGAAAFWISLAAVLIASGWFKSRSEAQKHETLRRMIEKTGTVDPAQMSELFRPSGPQSGWTNPELWKMPLSPPGENRKAAMIVGGIFISIAAGLAAVALILGSTGVMTPNDSTTGFAVAAMIAMFGLGMFGVSRFADPPPPKDPKDGGGAAR
jgi:hypothetical protein